METADYWKFFMETGAPEYYLLYHRSLRMEVRHVSDHPGHRSAGYGLQ